LRIAVAAAGGAVASYGRPNESAITSAAHPWLVDDPAAARLSWQVAQSRVGLRARGGPATGVLEVDFIDFNLATPTTAARPRLRVATVTLAEAGARDGLRFTLGQTWDAFAPLNPFHRNLVGGHFWAGNVGFMRHQAIVEHSGPSHTLSVAAGLPGSNNGLADGVLESTLLPSGALRAGWRGRGGWSLGGAGFVAPLALSADAGALAWGASGWAERQAKDGIGLRAELFAGQNLANTGMLSLGFAHLDRDGRPVDVQELGGWLSLRAPVGGPWALTATAGADAVLDPDAVLAAVTRPTPDTPGALDLAAGPGLQHNASGRAGVELQVTPALVVFGEGFTVTSAFAGLAAAPLWRGGAELGAMFTF
jgi:hypothetical protein